jgi:hypothetical protein
MSDKIKALYIESATQTSEANAVVKVKYGRDRYKIENGISEFVTIAIRDAMQKYIEEHGELTSPFKMPDGVLTVTFGDDGEARLHKVGEEDAAMLDVFNSVLEGKKAATERGRHLNEIRAAGGNSNRKRRFSRKPGGSNLLQS